MAMRMNDSIVVKHFCINWRSMSDKPNKVAEMRVADVNHRCNGKDEWWFLVDGGCRCALFLHLLYFLL